MGNIPFCDSCGKVLEIRKNEEGVFGICSCGLVKIIDANFAVSKKSEEKAKVGEGVAVEEETKGFLHTCKKCDYGECDIFDLGVPYSDESNIFLYKCKKCGYVERQADGSGNK